MAVVSIEIISDVICPWCFIGYRTLQRAIALYKKTYPGGSEDEFVIKWKPYFIDQVAPGTSVLINGAHASPILCIKPHFDTTRLIRGQLDRMARRMTHSQIEAAQTRLKRIGNMVGISFRFGGYMGSSVLAHRVLHLAFERGGSQMQCKVADILFQYQFELEKDVSLMHVVVEAAVEAGMDGNVVKEFLEGEGGKQEIERSQRKVKERGIKGVPCFWIGVGGKVGVQVVDGAGEMEEIFEALVRAQPRNSV
ncbi:hypothetical protein BDW72DRAFT_199175 [Aspergillus terricola var. indicus]